MQPYFAAGMKTCRYCRRGRSTVGGCATCSHDRSEAFQPQCSPAQRQPSAAGDHAFRATCTLPTVFPSLRAHEPLSCRARYPCGPGRRLHFSNFCSPNHNDRVAFTFLDPQRQILAAGSEENHPARCKKGPPQLKKRLKCLKLVLLWAGRFRSNTRATPVSPFSLRTCACAHSSQRPAPET